ALSVVASFPTRRSSDLHRRRGQGGSCCLSERGARRGRRRRPACRLLSAGSCGRGGALGLGGLLPLLLGAGHAVVAVAVEDLVGRLPEQVAGVLVADLQGG